MTFPEFSRRILAGAASEPRLPNWVVLRTVDSSNSLAKRLVVAARDCEEEPRPAVIVAWEQTAGRGRRQHRWNSPPALGVYTSLLLPRVARRRLPVLPLLTAVGLARGLGRHLDPHGGGGKIGLRWPNDLLVGGRKIGGILIEVVADDAGEPTVIVGYGVNHGQGLDELPADNATSVVLAAESPPPLPQLVVELASSVTKELEHLDDTAYAGTATAVERFSNLLVHREGDPMRCRTGEGIVQGHFAGLDDRGFLRLRVGSEVRTLAAGEVMDSMDRGSEGGTGSGESPGEDSDHSYFQSIEEVFIRLRGTPFLLSPEDWRVAAGWHREGIPVATVSNVLERIFSERQTGGQDRRSISGLRYFNRPVRAAWAQTRSMLGAEGSREADPLDVPARLRALSESIGALAAELGKPGDPTLGERILALRGTTEEVESELAVLDAELLETVRESLSGEERAVLESSIAEGLERIRKPMEPEEEAEIRLRLERQALRRTRDLPLLSLFSPAAEGAT